MTRSKSRQYRPPAQAIDLIDGPKSHIISFGLPTYKNSSHLRSSLDAPAVLAATVHRDEANPFTELGVDFGAKNAFEYLGDLALETEDDFEIIRTVSKAVFLSGKSPIFIGGDHSVTYPIIAGLHDAIGPVTLLHFDAHPDLYDDFQDNPLSHASPFARIMELGLVRGFGNMGFALQFASSSEVKRFGVHCNEMRNRKQWSMPAIEGPVYITIDLDAPDPAFAPGVSHYEPGGMSVRDILDIVHSLRVPIIGADIVELNPSRDRQNMTAIAGGKLLSEVGGMMLMQR
ncbi:MAG: arginase family protein [Burkholderiales bacterium]|nr:arginase family protein [Burkholderiales bacterium]